MLDLDHFKAVNDRYGHPRGDTVLIELGKRLTQEIREIDTLARYGGEEFVLLLPETDLVGAEQLAARVLAAVRERPFGGPDADRLPLTVSVGVAVRSPGSGMDAAPLLRAADAALYEAKRAGRDCYRVARPGMAAAPPVEPLPLAPSRDRNGLEVRWDQEHQPGPQPGGPRDLGFARRPGPPRPPRDVPRADGPRSPGALRRLGSAHDATSCGRGYPGHQGRHPGRGSGHPVPAGHQGCPQGTAAGRRHPRDRDDRGGGIRAPDCPTC